MDRLDAMKVFVAALDEGSLAAASRKLGRSPAAVSRAVAFLEDHVGVPLLYRTTRSSKLSEAGERYAAVCRRLLSELLEVDTLLAGETSRPRGTLSVTAPAVIGEEMVRPLLDAFLDDFPEVSAKLTLVEEPVNLIDEGVDVALRIGHLPDSTMIASRLGAVRRVLAAAPSYLAKHPPIETIGDLISHQIITMAHMGVDSWSFPPAAGSSIPRSVEFRPRLLVDSSRAAVASSIDGYGVIRIFSFAIAEPLSRGRLRIILDADKEPPVPVHLVMPDGRLSVPKVRAFVDFAVPRLRDQFAALAANAI